MKIAYLYPPASLNLGNSFFSEGGKHLLEQTFMRHEIRGFEFFDSGFRHFNSRSSLLPWKVGFGKGSSAFFTPATTEWIRNSADLVVVAGGGCMDPYFGELFDEIFSFGKPVLFWLVSASRFNVESVEFASKTIFHSQTIAVISRDRILPLKIKESRKLLPGLDGAYWMTDISPKPHRSAAYSVLNLETGGSLDWKQVAKITTPNYRTRDSDERAPVVVSNNNNIHHFWRNKNSVLITNAHALWDLYANASWVETTRLHTLVACLASGTPVKYVGIQDDRVVGLLGAVGVRLQSGQDFTAAEEEFSAQIEQTKRETASQIKAFLGEVVS